MPHLRTWVGFWRPSSFLGCDPVLRGASPEHLFVEVAIPQSRETLLAVGWVQADHVDPRDSRGRLVKVHWQSPHSHCQPLIPCPQGVAPPVAVLGPRRELRVVNRLTAMCPSGGSLTGCPDGELLQHHDQEWDPDLQNRSSVCDLWSVAPWRVGGEGIAGGRGAHRRGHAARTRAFRDLS
jgi:hypothetical protein